MSPRDDGHAATPPGVGPGDDIALETETVTEVLNEDRSVR